MPTEETLPTELTDLDLPVSEGQDVGVVGLEDAVDGTLDVASDADSNVVPAIADSEGSLLQMTSLVVPAAEEILNDPLFREMSEQLEVANDYHVFEVADAIAQQYMLEIVVPRLPSHRRRAAIMVITSTNYSKVPDGEMPVYLRLAAAHQSISRSIIAHVLETDEQAEDRGFNVLEAVELRGSVEFAGVMDSMAMKWTEMKHDCDEKKREELGFKSRWHMTVADAQDGFMEVPYQDFMLREYHDANFVLWHLIDNLTKLQGNPTVNQDLLAVKIDYYTKLAQALGVTDTVEVHKAWELAERAFVKQGIFPGNRVIATHSQEWSYATNASGIAPEFTIKVLVNDHPVDKLKAAALEEFQEKIPPLIANLPKALKGLDNISGGVKTVYPAIRSGSLLYFLTAGQNLPNHMNIRNEEGVVSNLSPEIMKKRLKEAEELFVKFFPEELLAYVDYDQALADISVHEIGHNLGDRNVLREGQEAHGCEEWKASGPEYALASLNAESISDRQLIGFAVSQLLQAMRYTMKRSEPSQYPYYISYLAFMREAQKTGVLQNTEGTKWELNKDRTNLLAWMDTVKGQWIEAQNIYENGTKDERDALVDASFLDYIPRPDGMEAVEGTRVMDNVDGKPVPSFMADVAQFVHEEENGV